MSVKMNQEKNLIYHMYVSLSMVGLHRVRLLHR